MMLMPDCSQDVPDVFDAVVKSCCHLLIPGGGQEGDGILPLLEACHIPQWTEEPQPGVGKRALADHAWIIPCRYHRRTLLVIVVVPT